MKKNKLNTEDAVAKIKSKIDLFHENLGRGMITDVDLERAELILEIDDILRNTKLPLKKIILEKFNLDKEKELNFIFEKYLKGGEKNGSKNN